MYLFMLSDMLILIIVRNYALFATTHNFILKGKSITIIETLNY